MRRLFSFVFATVAHAKVISLRIYNYEDSGTCSTLVDSQEYCNKQSCDFITCDKMKAFYSLDGMTEWGECFGEQNNKKVECEAGLQKNSITHFSAVDGALFNRPRERRSETKTTDQDFFSGECEYKSICTTVCSSSNTRCRGTCELSSYVLPDEQTCDGIRAAYQNEMDTFESFGHCFTFNNTDMQITCDDGPDQAVRIALIMGAMVLVAVLTIIMIIIYFRDRKRSKKATLIKQELEGMTPQQPTSVNKIDSGSAYI